MNKLGDLDKTVKWEVRDISKWQTTNIDFVGLKKSGVKGVIIRINKADTAMTKDPCFEWFYAKAKEAGLYVGAYWFTRATSLEYGRMEAQTCINWLKNKQFDLPIYLDIEGNEQFDLGKNFCTELCKTWCGTLQNANFFVGIYCSTFWYTNYVALSVRNQYATWIADWNKTCSYTGQYGMWQTGTTRDKAICSGNVDVDRDICYVDYPTAIKNRKMNGYGSDVLDCCEVWKFGQATWGIYSLKRSLRIAYNKCLLETKVTDSMVYDDTLKKAVNELLEKWHYKANSVLGSNFVIKLYNELDKVVK